jgi:hypothetical protein
MLEEVDGTCNRNEGDLGEAETTGGPGTMMLERRLQDWHAQES